MDKSAPPTFLFVLFPFIFVGMWCAISLVLALIGGWHRLAESYPARRPPSGRRFSMQSGKVGLVTYSSCLTVYASPEGLYLSLWLPFRLGHSPLFIPWDAIRNATTRRFLWAESVAFDVGSPVVATLRLSKKLFEGHPVADERVAKAGGLFMAIAFTGCVFAAPLLGAEPPAPHPKTDVAVIYFPGYHHDTHYDTWFGEGWNEWKLLAEAPNRFPGQRLFKPAWGPFDEADPKWMERQIALAADHGVSVFLFDWYWYSGVKFLHRPLENGFLKARNRNRLKFALMWANHDWGNFFPVPLDRDMEVLLPIRHSAEDFERVMDYCIEMYFRQPNYWRVGGGLYYSIFDPWAFMQQLGGPERTREVLDAARKQAESAGLGKMHFAAFAGGAEGIAKLQAAGFDSTTCYNVTASGVARLPERPLDDYTDLTSRHVTFWKEMDSGVLPHMPTVTVGWDTTPRWVKNAPWPPPPTRGYPYTTIVINNTPERFGVLVGKALDQIESARLRPPAMLVNAWNEWTEGSVLLPDVKYKTQFLDELKKALEHRKSTAAKAEQR